MMRQELAVIDWFNVFFLVQGLHPPGLFFFVFFSSLMVLRMEEEEDEEEEDEEEEEEPCLSVRCEISHSVRQAGMCIGVCTYAICVFECMCVA